MLAKRSQPFSVGQTSTLLDQRLLLTRAEGSGFDFVDLEGQQLGLPLGVLFALAQRLQLPIHVTQLVKYFPVRAHGTI